MKNQIIIHAAGKQTRIALIENGELAQFFIESPENQRTVGDIYLAEVHKVMSGIRAAFIDMGTPKDAFLHFSDVGDHLEDYIKLLNGDNAIKEKNSKKNGNHHKKSNDHDHNHKLSPGIEKQMRAGEILQPAHKLLVQIVKEPIGSKGPRVSTDITLAGRFLVLVPLGDYIGVSKRIRSYKERRRLRNIITSNLPDNFGVIVRTVADRQSEELLKEDLQQLLDKWESILGKLKTATPPALLYRDLDMTESLIRDLFAKDYNRLLIDDPAMYKSIRSYVSTVAPHMLPNLELYKGKEHIFDYMKISQDVESVFSPRVKMPSGGYLIFEQTEAMYVIDVNSGRYAAKKHQEDNSLKTNLEAAREITKQLRLRDIGGIIVVDFIDLKDDVNRKKVYDELKKEFKKDRAKTNVLQMSDFGLVQITRQRIRPSVVNSVSRICPMCGGSGSVVTQNTIVSDIEAWLTKFKHNTSYHAIDLYINPYLKSFLTRGLFSQRIKWMFKYGLKISMIGDDTISLNDFKFTLAGSDADITDAVILDKPIVEEIADETNDAVTTLEGPQKRDKSNLEVYENEKKEHPKHKHSNKQQYTKSKRNKKSDKEESDSKKNGYYKKSEKTKKDETPEDKEDKKSSSKSSSKTSSSRSKRSNKISKYYKGKDSDKDNNGKSSNNENNSNKKDTESNNDEEPRLAIEVAEEYHRKMQEKKKKAYTKKSSKDTKPTDAKSNKSTQATSNNGQSKAESSATVDNTVKTPVSDSESKAVVEEKPQDTEAKTNSVDVLADKIPDLPDTQDAEKKDKAKAKPKAKKSTAKKTTKPKKQATKKTSAAKSTKSTSGKKKKEPEDKPADNIDKRKNGTSKTSRKSTKTKAGATKKAKSTKPQSNNDEPVDASKTEHKSSDAKNNKAGVDDPKNEN
jgi:ribonuclease G